MKISSPMSAKKLSQTENRKANAKLTCQRPKNRKERLINAT